MSGGSYRKLMSNMKAANAAPNMLALLKKLAWYYDVNDCQERSDDDTMEIPILDLRNAYELVTAIGENPEPH